jgi:hypothetical protein
MSIEIGTQDIIIFIMVGGQECLSNPKVTWKEPKADYYYPLAYRKKKRYKADTW